MSKPTLALLETQGIGRKSAIKILQSMWKENYPEHDWSPELLLEAIQGAHHTYSHIRVPSIDDVREGFRKATDIIRAERAEGVRLVSVRDSGYPSALRSIPDPPALLHIKTNCPVAEWWTALGIAIIGTRNASDHGSRVARRLGTICADAEFTVVSGLAVGCDTAAHEGALDADGKTTAVLAHGLDRISPKRNEGLAQRILEQGGMLISEYAFDTSARRGQYVERNRIQSGLSKGVIVVEASAESGTLHTVDYASGQKRAIAVYEPKASYNVTTSGNEKAKREYRARSVSDPSSLRAFLDRCRHE